MRLRQFLPLLLVVPVLLSGCGEGGASASPRPSGRGRTSGPPAPEPGAFLGEVVDLGCYLRQGGRGPVHQPCAEACLRLGRPAGLLTADGDLLLLIAEPKSGADFSAFAARRCRVKGSLVRRDALRGILVEALDEAPPEPPPAPPGR